MGAHISFAAQLIMLAFLGVVMSVVSVNVYRYLSNRSVSRQHGEKKSSVSHQDAARARAAARFAARNGQVKV